MSKYFVTQGGLSRQTFQINKMQALLLRKAKLQFSPCRVEWNDGLDFYYNDFLLQGSGLSSLWLRCMLFGFKVETKLVSSLLFDTICISLVLSCQDKAACTLVYIDPSANW